MKLTFTLKNRFVVSLILCNLFFTGCTKKPLQKPDTDYTKNMGGARSWDGSYYESDADPSNSSVSHITDYNYTDTVFEIIVLNSTTVKVFNDTFSYERTDDVLKVYYFGTAWEYYKYGSGKGVAYFYDSDSLVYVSGILSNAQTTIDIRTTYKR